MGWTLKEAKEIPVLAETDVLVVGGARQVLPLRFQRRETGLKQC